MIKTILFDLGNVILPFDITRPAKRLTAYSKLNADEIAHHLCKEAVAHAFESGKLSPHEYFQHAKKSCEFEGLTYEDFSSIFCGIFDDDYQVIQLIEKLKPNYKLGVISNINEIHASFLVSTRTYLKQFDNLVFSHIAGLRKPDPAIYRIALDHFASDPNQTIFIDDLHPNVISASQLGINSIHYKNVSSLKEQLEKLGVLV